MASLPQRLCVVLGSRFGLVSVPEAPQIPWQQHLQEDFHSLWLMCIFFYLGFTTLSRIFLLYRADRSSKVGENRRTRGKTTRPSVSRTWLSQTYVYALLWKKPLLPPGDCLLATVSTLRYILCFHHYILYLKQLYWMQLILCYVYIPLYHREMSLCPLLSSLYWMQLIL